MLTRRTLLTSATALFALSLAAPAIAEADKPTPVVATFSILGDMVKRIGGEHVALTTLVGPDGDTHVYQPTPADARALSEARRGMCAVAFSDDAPLIFGSRISTA